MGRDLSGPTDPSEPCGCGSGAAAEPSTTTDPVNTATGDYYTTVTDVSVPNSVPPLTFSRTYDVISADAEAGSGSSPPPLGYGWTSNLGMSVSYDSSTGVATVTQENGSQVTFTDSMSKEWCAGLSTNFCATAPRMEATLDYDDDAGTWVMTRYVDGTTVFDFDSSGLLDKVSTGAGSLTRTSLSSCPDDSENDCVQWQAQATGDTTVNAALDIESNPSTGELVSVFDATTGSGLSSSYSYSGSGCTDFEGSDPEDLCSVDDPGSQVYAYGYSGGSAEASAYEMTDVTSPDDSSPLVNTFDSSGRVVTQTSPTGLATSFSYLGDYMTRTGGETIVTTTDGAESEEADYFYAYGALVASYGVGGAAERVYVRDSASLENTAVASGAPLGRPSDDPNTWTTNTFAPIGSGAATEVGAGDLTLSTDADGDTTQYAYTSDNLVWCTVLPDQYASGTRCPSSEPTSVPEAGDDPYPGAAISYYNSSDQLIAKTDPLGNTTVYAYTDGVTGLPNGLQYCSVDPADYLDGVACPSYPGSPPTAGDADPNLGVAISFYNSSGELTAETDALGNTTAYAYTHDVSGVWA